MAICLHTVSILSHIGLLANRKESRVIFVHCPMTFYAFVLPEPRSFFFTLTLSVSISIYGICFRSFFVFTSNGAEHFQISNSNNVMVLCQVYQANTGILHNIRPLPNTFERSLHNPIPSHPTLSLGSLKAIITFKFKFASLCYVHYVLVQLLIQLQFVKF